MYEHQIDNMARTVQHYLADFRGIQVEAEDIAEPLREHWTDFAVHVWHIEDIFFQAENMALPMSRSLAREILKGIEAKIDCENGITWVTIDDAIQREMGKINWSELSDAAMEVFSGNLGGDPEMRYTPTGQAVTNFSVAANRRYTASDGQKIDETTWFRVAA